MGITRLSQPATQKLGSSVVIVTPLSVVKELVDNAIDATATAIDVLVSPNTVDKIEVRDNGHGIPPDDFNALGRAAHTSKLRSLEELQCKGGKTLGFRGDALASINNMSTVIVMTRTTQTLMGYRLSIRPNEGGIESQKSIAMSVGTTARITDIFQNFPVRRQSAVKESRKVLPRIKQLLQFYSLAKPNLKLTFKVQGEDQWSWSFSPKPSGGIRDAVVQVLGSEVANHCHLRTWSGGSVHRSMSAGDALDAQNNTNIYLEAVLAKATANPKNISGKGCFFSIDSRPLTAARGTMKKLSSCYQNHLMRSMRKRDAAHSLKIPFLRLNIVCPPGSYDPNVTPAKDEVMFSNEQRILDLFEDLCQDVYGQAQSPSEPLQLQFRLHDAREVRQSDVDEHHTANIKSGKSSPQGRPGPHYKTNEASKAILREPTQGEGGRNSISEAGPRLRADTEKIVIRIGERIDMLDDGTSSEPETKQMAMRHIDDEDKPSGTGTGPVYCMGITSRLGSFDEPAVTGPTPTPQQGRNPWTIARAARKLERPKSNRPNVENMLGYTDKDTCDLDPFPDAPHIAKSQTHGLDVCNHTGGQIAAQGVESTYSARKPSHEIPDLDGDGESDFDFIPLPVQRAPARECRDVTRTPPYSSDPNRRMHDPTPAPPKRQSHSQLLKGYRGSFLRRNTRSKARSSRVTSFDGHEPLWRGNQRPTIEPKDDELSSSLERNGAVVAKGPREEGRRPFATRRLRCKADCIASRSTSPANPAKQAAEIDGSDPRGRRECRQYRHDTMGGSLSGTGTRSSVAGQSTLRPKTVSGTIDSGQDVMELNVPVVAHSTLRKSISDGRSLEQTPAGMEMGSFVQAMTLSVTDLETLMRLAISDSYIRTGTLATKRPLSNMAVPQSELEALVERWSEGLLRI